MQILRIAMLVWLLFVGSAYVCAEQTVRLFRIGTGSSSGTYFPIGSLIASAISANTGINTQSRFSRPDLLAVAQRSNGSVANIFALGQNWIEAALVQADVAYWAFKGSGPFAGRPAHETLRAIANLYPESVHLISRVGSGIRSVDDLRGQRVSLDEPGSGTLIDVREILRAFKISDNDIKVLYVNPSQGAELIRQNKLDAFFIIAGFPVKLVEQLVQSGAAELVPISGPQVNRIIDNNKIFTESTIPAGTYGDQAQLSTLAVGAQLVTTVSLDDELIYQITGMLWSTSTLALLSDQHRKGGQIQIANALSGVAIPVHPGAARYYRELGLAVNTELSTAVPQADADD